MNANIQFIFILEKLFDYLAFYFTSRIQTSLSLKLQYS